MILATFILLATILCLAGSESTTRDFIRDNKLLCKLYPDYCSDETIDATTEVAPVVQLDKVMKEFSDKLQRSKQENVALNVEATNCKVEASNYKVESDALKRRLDELQNEEERYSALAKQLDELKISFLGGFGFLLLAGFIAFAYHHRDKVTDVEGNNANGDGNALANGGQGNALAPGNYNAAVPGDGNALAPGDANNAGGHDNAGGQENHNLQMREFERATVNYITHYHYYTPVTNSLASAPGSEQPQSAPEPVYSSLRRGRRRRVA